MKIMAAISSFLDSCSLAQETRDKSQPESGRRSRADRRDENEESHDSELRKEQARRSHKTDRRKSNDIKRDI